MNEHYIHGTDVLGAEPESPPLSHKARMSRMVLCGAAGSLIGEATLGFVGGPVGAVVGSLLAIHVLDEG